MDSSPFCERLRMTKFREFSIKFTQKFTKFHFKNPKKGRLLGLRIVDEKGIFVGVG